VVGDLAGVGRVIAYDRRGYRRSGGEVVRSASEHAVDAAAVLEALEASRQWRSGRVLGRPSRWTWRSAGFLERDRCRLDPGDLADQRAQSGEVAASTTGKNRTQGFGLLGGCAVIQVQRHFQPPSVIRFGECTAITALRPERSTPSLLPLVTCQASKTSQWSWVAGPSHTQLQLTSQLQTSK